MSAPNLTSLDLIVLPSVPSGPLSWPRGGVHRGHGSNDVARAMSLGAGTAKEHLPRDEGTWYAATILYQHTLRTTVRYLVLDPLSEVLGDSTKTGTNTLSSEIASVSKCCGRVLLVTLESCRCSTSK